MKTKIVVFVLGGLTGAIAVFTLPIDSELSRMQVIQLRAENTGSMNGLGQVSELLYENSDLMQRFSHYTDGHPRKVMVCPECSVGEESIFGPEEITVDEDTHVDQSLVEDGLEVKQGIDRIRTSLLNQNQTLSYTLKRLRENAVTATSDDASAENDVSTEDH